MKRLILTVLDSNGKKINIDDTVSVKCKSIQGLIYYTTMALINSRLYPHDFFTSAWIEVVEEIPADADLINPDHDNYPKTYVLKTSENAPDFDLDLAFLRITRARGYRLSVEDL